MKTLVLTSQKTKNIFRGNFVKLYFFRHFRAKAKAILGGNYLRNFKTKLRTYSNITVSHTPQYTVVSNSRMQKHLVAFDNQCKLYAEMLYIWIKNLWNYKKIFLSLWSRRLNMLYQGIQMINYVLPCKAVECTSI